MRFHIENNFELGVYRAPLPRSLDWAACYLADEDIPGTAAYRRQQKLGDAMLAMLMDEPPAKASRKTIGAKGAKK